MSGAPSNLLVAMDLGIVHSSGDDLLSQFLEEEKSAGGSQWVVEPMPTPDADSVLKYLKTRPEVKSVRFAEKYFDKIMSELNLHSPDMLTTGSTDCLFFERSGWWSMSLLKKALIWGAGQVGKVDIRKAALFCGDSRSVGAIMSVFVHVGYSNVYWYSGTDSKEEEGLVVFRKNHFGAKLHRLSTEEFRMLGPICSMAVLKTIDAPSEVLVEEMNYFNYLIPGGVFFDANWENLSETLDQQIKDQGFHFVPSKTVRLWMDRTWVEAMKKGRVV